MLRDSEVGIGLEVAHSGIVANASIVASCDWAKILDYFQSSDNHSCCDRPVDDRQLLAKSEETRISIHPEVHLAVGDAAKRSLPY